MEAKLRQMANSSAFAERPGLPSKPAAPQRGAPSQRLSGRGMTSGVAQRTRNDGDGIARGRRDADSSDMMKIPPSSKQRSIPGVKIVKGGKSGITPST